MRTRSFYRPPPPGGGGGGGYSFVGEGFEAGVTLVSRKVRPAALDTEIISYAYPDDNIATYATLADIQTAITAGRITSGKYARLVWTGDTYHGSGEVIVRSVQSRPSWKGVIPWSKVGYTATVLGSSGSGALGADGGGRPLLTVGAADGDFVEVLTGVKGAPARRVRLHGQFQSAAVANNAADILSSHIRRDGDPTKMIRVFNRYTGGTWLGGWLHTSTGGTATDPLDTDATNVSKYAAARAVSFDMLFGLTGAQPTAKYTYDSPGDGSGAPAATTTATGEGAFTVATQIWQQYVRLRSTGAAGSFIVTGIEYDTRS